MKKSQLISNLYARVRELEDLYFEATGKEAPPSSFDISHNSRTPRASKSSRQAVIVEEDMAALTHPIIKDGKTARDKRMEVLAATQDLFVSDLEKLWSQLLVPLRDSCTKTGATLVEANELAALLDKLSSLLEVHRRLRLELDSRVAQWVKGGECIGDVLLRFAPMLRAAHRWTSQDFALVNGWRTNHPHSREIDLLLHSAEKSCGESLSNLMLQPILRLGTYAHIIEEFLLLTPTSHADRANLVAALTAYKDLEAAADVSSVSTDSSVPSSARSLRGSASLTKLQRGSIGSGPNSPRSGASSSGTLRSRLQHSLSQSLVKGRFSGVEDGFRNSLRKKSVTQASEVFASSSGGGGGGGAPSSPSSPSLSGDGLEPLALSEALNKLFNPDGCEEEFENVFLGLFHYFMSWSLFIHHFGVVAKQVREVPPVTRSRHSNRLVQVVTKWLRLNQTLRNERMSAEEARLELERHLAGDNAQSASSSRVSGDSTPTGTYARELAQSAPAAVLREGNSPRAIELESEDESSDDAPVPVAAPATPLSGSKAKIVMGSKKRPSVFKESQTVVKAVAAPSLKLDDLNKLLASGSESESSEGPPAHLANLSGDRPAQVLFVVVMDEWVRSLPNEDFLPLIKYWEQWRFPKKSRQERRDSLYYRSLQRSKSQQSVLDPAAEFLTLESEALARQMTLQELNTFKCITRKELCQRHFLEPETGPNFQCMVAQFNLWTGWVLEAVLKPDGAGDRGVVLGRLIDLADHCHELGNFNSSYAIVAGLTHPQLARLKLSWEQVNKNSMKKFSRLLELWDVSGNYRRYRDMLKTVAPPCVPYLGLLGKDLFSMEENSKTILPNKLINFKKLKLLWSTISFVEDLQQYEYPGMTEDAKCASFLASIKGMDEAAAKERSRAVEPRV